MLKPEEKKLIADLAKFKNQRCLEPTEECQEYGIRAHSIANKAILELLQRDGHVIVPEVKINTDTGPEIEFNLVGRNKASTFTGLCARHDNELFQDIEKQQTDFSSPWHRFLISYRAVIRQLHVDMENAIRLQLAFQEKVKLGRAPKDVPSAPGMVATEQIVYALEMHEYKKVFDRAYLTKNLREIFVSHIVLKGLVPTISVNSLITAAPPGTPTLDAPPFILNVIPQPNKTHLLFAALKQHVPKLRPVMGYLARSRGEEKLMRLSSVILKNCENFVISPQFYDSLSEKKKESMTAYFVESITKPDVDPGNIPCLFATA